MLEFKSVQEFVKKFLPNDTEKEKTGWEGIWDSYWDDSHSREVYVNSRFPEALEAFAKAQREECAMALQFAIDSDYDDSCPFEDDIYDKDAEKMYNIIKNAPMPTYSEALDKELRELVSQKVGFDIPAPEMEERREG